MSQRRSSKNQSNAGQAQRGAKGSSSTVSRRAQRRIDEENKRKRQRMMLFGGAVVLAVVVVGVLIALNRPEDDDTSDLAVTVPAARDASIPQDGRTLGNPDAPVTVVQYADFQCPACGQFARNIEPQLVEDYVRDGRVRIEFHDFPFLDNRSDGNESDDASEAAFCAQDQGKFWAYHDVLFANQSGENQGAFSRSRLIEFARNVEGLDVDQFTTCFDDGDHAEEVQALYQASIDSGVNSTPTFDVNGQRVSGSNYASLREQIEAALAN